MVFQDSKIEKTEYFSFIKMQTLLYGIPFNICLLKNTSFHLNEIQIRMMNKNLNDFLLKTYENIIFKLVY
jgi:hypothetical protein